MIVRRLTTCFGWLAICATLLNAGVSRAQDSAPEVVGEITTLIGQGVIRNASGEQAAARGQRIRAGDRIETGEGGHVHIRFVDGGLVSVRPLSRLVVEEYSNAGSHSLAAIKFRLEEGVVRSVTGQWGEASRDRFRLNTPIAAIGVKGTDFVVKVENGKTFASVISGAIIMAPLEGACTSSLGPCQHESAAHLSAEMKGQMLEYLQKNGSGGPRLVPSVDLLARNSLTLPQNEARRSESVAATDKTRNGETLAARTLNTMPIAAPTTEVSTPISVPATVPTPEPVVEPTGKALVWLHNIFAWNVQDNTISVPYSTARADGRTAIAGNFFITLYRDETLQSAFLPKLSNVNFTLTSASANFIQPVAANRPVEVAQVSNATLNVDFARSTFVTQLQLASPSLGTQQLQASGGIGSTGIFTGSGTNQSVTGAFSTDGLQAGYLFDKTVSNGTVSGLTLWRK